MTVHDCVGAQLFGGVIPHKVVVFLRLAPPLHRESGPLKRYLVVLSLLCPTQLLLLLLIGSLHLLHLIQQFFLELSELFLLLIELERLASAVCCFLYSSNLLLDLDHPVRRLVTILPPFFGRHRFHVDVRVGHNE